MAHTLNADEQIEWLTDHLPNRVRAATARLDMRGSILNIQALIDPPPCITEQNRIYWRFATDSIWQGRLVATRWLIELVGIKLVKGQPGRPQLQQYDVDITSFIGGYLIDTGTNEAQTLAALWKGCSQASSHATHNSGHPLIEEDHLIEALSIILDHLSKTIYRAASISLPDYVLQPPPKDDV